MPPPPPPPPPHRGTKRLESLILVELDHLILTSWLEFRYSRFFCRDAERKMANLRMSQCQAPRCWGQNFRIPSRFPHGRRIIATRSLCYFFLPRYLSCRGETPFPSIPSPEQSVLALTTVFSVRASKKFPDLRNGAEIMGFLCWRGSARNLVDGEITPRGHLSGKDFGFAFGRRAFKLSLTFLKATKMVAPGGLGCMI